MEPQTLVYMQGCSLDQLKEVFRSVVREEIILAKAQEENTLISIKDVVKLFSDSVTEQTIRNWSEAGLLKKKKIGRRIFYDKSEVLEATKGLKKYDRKTRRKRNYSRQNKANQLR